MKNDVLCKKCKVKINQKEDHFVRISTFNRRSVKTHKKLADDHVYFHINCWKTYFLERVTETARQQVKFLQSEAFSLFDNPEIKAMLSQIHGTEGLFQMLNTPLGKEKVVTKEDVIDKIKNDRRKEKTEKKRN